MFSERPQTSEQLIPPKVPTFYLDNNLLVGLYDGRFNPLKDKLIRSIAEEKLLCPFTAEQVDEFAVPIRHADERTARLMLLSNLSIDRYFRDTPAATGFSLCSPFEIFDELEKYAFTRSFQKNISSVFPRQTMNLLREEYQIDPNAIANKDASEGIAYIDDKLKNYRPSNYSEPSMRPTSLSETLGLIMDILRVQEPMLLETNSTRVVLLFSLLDSFGYRPDSGAEYDKGSRYPDARHVSLAAHFNALVSEDRKMRAKASAVYEYLGIPVEIYDASCFEKLIDRSLKI